MTFSITHNGAPKSRDTHKLKQDTFPKDEYTF